MTEQKRIDYKIEILKPEEAKKAVEFLRNEFFKYEPMVTSLGINVDPADDPLFERVANSGYSVKAVNNKGEIIGVILSDLIKRDDPEDNDNDEEDDILRLLSYINTKFNIFENVPENVDQVLDLKFISVHSDYGRAGIGQKMVAKSMELMKTWNISIAFCMCSSHYSAKLCQKSGMNLVYRLAYADYFVDGKNPILPAKPHEAIEIFLKEI